jgi:hypothetical protein
MAKAPPCALPIRFRHWALLIRKFNCHIKSDLALLIESISSRGFLSGLDGLDLRSREMRVGDCYAFVRLELVFALVGGPGGQDSNFPCLGRKPRKLSECSNKLKRWMQYSRRVKHGSKWADESSLLILPDEAFPTLAEGLQAAGGSFFVSVELLRR